MPVSYTHLGAEPLVKTDDVAPDSIAADEIDAGKVKVC